MRWTSKGFLVTLRIPCITTGPKLILGTKCPSITSIWIQSAPASSMARTSSPSFEKSAERIDGAMRSGRFMSDVLAHGDGGVRHTVGEAPFIVIPGEHAHQIAVHDLRLIHVESR